MRDIGMSIACRAKCVLEELSEDVFDVRGNVGEGCCCVAIYDEVRRCARGNNGKRHPRPISKELRYGNKRACISHFPYAPSHSDSTWYPQPFTILSSRHCVSTMPINLSSPATGCPFCFARRWSRLLVASGDESNVKLRCCSAMSRMPMRLRMARSKKVAMSASSR